MKPVLVVSVLLVQLVPAWVLDLGIAQEYRDGSKVVAQEILADARKQGVKRLAVTHFVDVNGQQTRLGGFLSEELSVALAAPGVVQIVDHRLIVQAFKESGLPPSLSHLGSEELKHIGEALTIDAVVAGSLYELTDSVLIIVKMVGTQNGAILGAARWTLSKTKDIAELAGTFRGQSATALGAGTSGSVGGPAGMVLVPAGTFLFGEGEQQQRVVLPQFWIDLLEVTNADYAKLRLHRFEPNKAGHPVTGVSWQEAQLFCHANGKRLPSEQEWEKAARGTDGRSYPWGHTYDPGRVNAENRHRGATSVGSFPSGASPYGVHDMAGNAMEWTSSDDGQAKVLRGGSWASSPDDARTTSRNRVAPVYRLPDVGFRCVKDFPQEATAHPE